MLKKLKHQLFRKRLPWEQNIFVLWFGTFMAGMGFSEIMPFMSLYIDTLGHFSTAQLNFYSGITFSATYFVTAIASPLWGRLADRKGRKLMILRASLGMAIVLGAMGLVTNVWELIALRLIQGVFSGYISNANALVATESPKEHSGQALGTLVTGFTAGNLLGPLLGGALAASFGYRFTFFITGGLLLIVFFLSWFFVHEHFTPVEKTALKSTKEVIKSFAHPRLIFAMLITTTIIQVANQSISPILSLYVRQLLHGHGSVSLIAGIIAAIPGIATIIAAPRLGVLGDRIGTERILTIGFIFAICVFIPMAFVKNVWELGFFRFLIGISDATMMPAVQTLLAKNSPMSTTGRVFSWNQSFMAMGSIIGPLIGSAVSGTWGYGAVFLSTGVIVALNLALFTFNTHDLRQSAN
ncbi:multidrug efflux MFS transporter [Furfurilactobacillus entadae]|uniref:multidrug efflux MFS transporter n=1 Tax=Furfurilactobacillus entadae TaxID=2922307 RepID=UPI0035EBC523